MYVRNLMHQILNLLQLHRGCPVLYDRPHSLGVSLQAADQLFVRRRHPTGQQLRHLGLQALGLIGQLANHRVPDGEAPVTAFTGGELAQVAPGTFVTPSSRNALHTGTLTRGLVTLPTGDSLWVAVTSWKHREPWKKKERHEENLGRHFFLSDLYGHFKPFVCHL